MPKKKDPPDLLAGQSGVHVDAIAEGPQSEMLPGGFAIPRRFQARADSTFVSDEPSAATITVEVADGRARSVEVAVKTSQPSGVTSTMLMRVPIREIVAKGALRLLRRVEPFDENSAKLLPVDETDADVIEAIRRLVGWVPKKGARS